MTRLPLTLAGLLQVPDKPFTPLNYAAYIGRLSVVFGGLGLLVGSVLVLLFLTGYAHASAPQRSPETPRSYGCAIVLSDPEDRGDNPYVLEARSLKPWSECDESAPVSFGASVRDDGIGRAR